MRKGDRMKEEPTSSRESATVLQGIAHWVKRYRRARGLREELANCSPDEVARIAKDLRIASDDLVALAKKGPGAADLLQKLLVALGVDPKGLAHTDPAVMRDLQRLCVTCGHKQQCTHDLDIGVMNENFRDYCPNAYTLTALLKSQQ
jgi:hypothetical protein